MLRSYRDQAIVLRSYKLGEADRIVILLGRKSGQIRAVAKGVRRTTSKFGSRLSSFNLVDLQLHRGRNLETITQAETLQAYSDGMSKDYATFTNAKLMVETVQKLTDGHDDADPGQFNLLHGALHALATKTRPPALTGGAHLLRSMALEGWQPALDHCVSCSEETGLAFFSAEGGGTFCASCAPADAVKLQPGVAGLMADLLVGDWEGALAWPEALWDQAHHLAGAWAQWHLEQRLRSLPFAAVGGRNG